MMARWRPHLEIPALVALALLGAAASNRLAGPTRRLSWFPRPAPRAAAPVPAPAAPATPPKPPEPAAPPPARPIPGPKASPAASAPLEETPLARYPLRPGQPQLDIDGDAARWLQARRVVFIDARRTAAYVQGHIPGARSLAVWEDDAAAKIEELAAFTADFNQPVVVYCSGGSCEDSHLLAQKLWLAGFRNLLIYVGGLPDWEGRGLPVTRGEQP